MKIGRADFIAAIEAGITAANLEPHENERLLNIALTANVVGTNYSTGCPATIAGLDENRPEVQKFANAYDRYVIATLGRDWFFAHKHLVIS